jgi:hypothetical protein
MVVVRAAGLRVHGGTVIPPDAAPPAGELAVFCRPVVPAPAAARRDGTVPADAWLPDLVRLGELERHPGGGVIEEIVAAAVALGRPRKRERRRILSYPLVIRLMIAMALMPDASCCGALARLAGLLAGIPFTLGWHVPAEKVITAWRLPASAEVTESVFWRAAGPLTGEDEPPAVLLAGKMACAAGGMLVNIPGTETNRKAFGSTGTADDPAPFPQPRIVALTARAGRPVPGAIPGGSSAGEQALLKRLARRRPDLAAGRVICLDRNFPGHDLITAILDAGGHVIARVKEGISPGLEDGPGRGRLPARAAEHSAILPSGDGTEEISRTCTLITTLPDHQAAPADAIRDTYLTRRSAPETTPGEDKTTITGAGNRTSGPVPRPGSPRPVIQEARAWLTAARLARASTALHTLNIPGRQRHSERAQKARPKFPHASAAKTTVTGKPKAQVPAPGFS